MSQSESVPPVAAAWIAPADEIDRGNLLGAAVVIAQRRGRGISDVVEGRDNGETAFAAARRTGMLIVPSPGDVLPGTTAIVELLDRAWSEGWRLLTASFGLDSSTDAARRLRDWAVAQDAVAAEHLEHPLPPRALRSRVADGDEWAFRRAGLLHARAYLDAAGEAARRPGLRVLDWGAGCGRMSAHLRTLLPDAHLTAADVDAEAIGWIAGALRVDATAVLPLSPPSTLPGGTFDLIVGHSVLTHLDAETQTGWVAELHRLLAPGGTAVVSVNGPTAWAWHLEHPLADLGTTLLGQWEADGEAFWTEDGWEAQHHAGYHTSFTTEAVLRRRWSASIEVVRIIEAGARPTQDLVVLRRPADG